MDREKFLELFHEQQNQLLKLKDTKFIIAFDNSNVGHVMHKNYHIGDYIQVVNGPDEIPDYSIFEVKDVLFKDCEIRYLIHSGHERHHLYTDDIVGIPDMKDVNDFYKAYNSLSSLFSYKDALFASAKIMQLRFGE